jgi:hypothetical protein
MKAVSRNHWMPVLAGESAARCLAIARATAEQVCNAVRAASADPSLVAGYAGASLVAYEVGHVCSDDALIMTGKDMLELALDLCAESEPVPLLHYGFPGIAWAAQYMCDADERPDVKEIDDALAELLEEPWRHDFDLLRGIVGLGVYGLTRLPDPTAQTLVATTVRHLGATAERTREGVAWYTRPEWMLPEMLKVLPRGYYSLGAAHGIPSVIAFLALAEEAGIEPGLARGLATSAVKWLLAQRRGSADRANFPSYVGQDIPWRRARSAWCYGAPGIAIALLVAARALRDDALAAEAVAVGLAAADRPFDEAGIRDAGLCHGATGLGLIFQRLFNETGHPRFADAAQDWFLTALEMRVPGRGLGGFLAFAGDDLRSHWESNHTLLAGSGGIALALAAAAGERAPDWDALLLLSPPRPRARRDSAIASVGETCAVSPSS